MIGESTVNENAARYVRRVGPVVIPGASKTALAPGT